MASINSTRIELSQTSDFMSVRSGASFWPNPSFNGTPNGAR